MPAFLKYFKKIVIKNSASNLSQSQTKKYLLLKSFVICAFFILSVRLFQIQVLNTSRYRAQAKQQQVKGSLIQPKRGAIYTSDGYPVAQSIPAFIVGLDATTVSDLDFDHIQQITQIPTIEITQLKSSKNKKAKLSLLVNYEQQQLLQLIDRDQSKFTFTSAYQRVYGENAFMADILGFVGKDKDGLDVGYYGLEQYYNGDLLGQPGQTYEARSASGKAILWDNLAQYQAIDGSNIYTTIDRTVQYIVEKHLEDGIKRYNAKSAVAIIVEPKTGHIIAMSNYPDYIPGEYTNYRDQKDILRNDGISAIYEPGSIIKGITLASAIDAGKVALDETYNDTGAKLFSGHKVDNWDGKHHGQETLAEILQHSNNLGAAWLGLKLGDIALMRYFKEFGFGQKLGIDLEGEESGILYSQNNLKDIEIVNASFGQGISVTPLQAVMAFSAIANDGYLMQPMVVKKIVTQQKEILIEPKVFSRPISKSTSAVMVELLTQAATGGEAKSFITKKYKIAGKTGTAQIPVKGGYDKHLTNATFVGFLPSYKNFVILVKLEKPSFPSGYASETAVPLWMRIAEDLAMYYSLPSDK